MKKETWKFILQTLAAIITALCTSLGISSCVSAAREKTPTETAATDSGTSHGHSCTACGHWHQCQDCGGK